MDNEEFSGIMDEPMARIEETERSGAKPDEETVRTRLQEIAVRAREAPDLTSTASRLMRWAFCCIPRSVTPARSGSVR